MPTYGMPSMIELETVQEAAALCSDLKLSFLELNTYFPSRHPQLLNPQELKTLADVYGIFYTIHLNDELNVADFDPHIAKGYRDSVLEVIELAKKIHAPVLNMHLSGGAYYTMPDRKIHFFEAYKKEYLQGMVQFRDLCTEAIGDAPIRICVENTSGYKPFQLEALELLLESSVFGLTLDIGHNACAGFADEGWILGHADRLHHMHIHDVYNGKKDHLALGTGEMDVQKYLQIAASQQCTVVVEVKTVEGLCRSVQWMQQNQINL